MKKILLILICLPQKIKQSDWKEIINLGNEDMFEIIEK